MTEEKEQHDEPEPMPEDPQAEDATPDAGPAEPEEPAGAPLGMDEAAEAAPDEAEEAFEDLAIEPEEEAAASSPAEAVAEPQTGPKAEAEPPREPQPLPVESLDACPNCGSPMREKDALVCLRCGYDLKHLKVIETETEDRAKAKGRKKEKAELEEVEERRPLAREGLGGLRLPLVLAVLAAAALIIGYLAGYQGLFPAVGEAAAAAEEAAPIEWARRFTELGKFPVLIGLWTLCAMGALVAGSWLFGRPLGDVGLGAARMLGIIIAAFCVRFLPVQDKVLSFAAEAAAALAVFFLLTMFFFRLRPRDAGTLLGLTLLACIVLYVGAKLMAWAM